MKELRCEDVGMKECKFVARGMDDAEVMKKAGDHGKTAHGMQTIPPDVERKAKAAIRDSR